MEKINAQIEKLHMEDLRNTQHPAIFHHHESYTLLIVRIPSITEQLDITSLGFLFTPEASYLFNPQSEVLEKLDQRFNTPYQKIDKALDKLLISFQTYQDHISDMESSLYDEQNIKHFMSHWLRLKRDIVRIERVMLRTSGALKSLIEYYTEEESFPLHHYLDIHEHCERILRAATLQLSKLDYLYNFYNTRTNEKMNRLIFLLTIISAIFLPLNLMVGFFGMNTSGLPFTAGTMGTSKALFLMGTLVIITSIIVIIWRRKIDALE